MQATLKYGFVAFSLAMLVGCGNANNGTAQAPASNASSSTAPAGTVVRIATESSFKPFSYMDNQGNPVGFEIDLANAMCKEMKVECKISSEDWDSLIPGLNAKKFDAIMAGMSVTPERSQSVLFSQPYFQNKLVLVAKKDQAVGLKDVAGKTVAVQQATVSAEYLEKNHPTAQIKNYDKQDNAYLDLAAGRVDFMLSDLVPISDWLKTDAGKGFEVKGEPIDINDSVAIAVRKDDNALADQFNAALQTLKSNGEYDKIAQKYFEQGSSASAPASATK